MDALLRRKVQWRN